ncbi:GSCOCG00012852001-RA-CDS, partial [Cotesia congregata]
KITELHNTLNNYHPRLKFTIETESNNKHVNYLDLKIIRVNNHIETNIYIKPTFSGRYINYQSEHPNSHKIGTIYSLVDKVFYLADKKFNSEILASVNKILTDNGYPQFYIRKHIDNRWKYLINKKNKVENNNIINNNLNYKYTVSFPYCAL